MTSAVSAIAWTSGSPAPPPSRRRAQRGAGEANDQRGERHRLDQGVARPPAFEGQDRGGPARQAGGDNEQHRRVGDQDDPDYHPREIPLQEQEGSRGEDHRHHERRVDGHASPSRGSVSGSAASLWEIARANDETSPTAKPKTRRKTPMSNRTAVITSRVPRCMGSVPGGGKWVRTASPKKSGAAATPSATSNPTKETALAWRTTGRSLVSSWPKAM